MANFGSHLAYPLPAWRAPQRQARDHHASAGTGVAARLGAGVRRLLQAALRSLDEAPFDLAWPPSPRLHAERARRH